MEYEVRLAQHPHLPKFTAYPEIRKSFASKEEAMTYINLKAAGSLFWELWQNKKLIQRQDLLPHWWSSDKWKQAYPEYKGLNECQNGGIIISNRNANLLKYVIENPGKGIYYRYKTDTLFVSGVKPKFKAFHAECLCNPDAEVFYDPIQEKVRRWDEEYGCAYSKPARVLHSIRLGYQNYSSISKYLPYIHPQESKAGIFLRGLAAEAVQNPEKKPIFNKFILQDVPEGMTKEKYYKMFLEI